MIKNKLINKLVTIKSSRNIYSLTNQWPITCTYDPKCTFNHLKEIEKYWNDKVINKDAKDDVISTKDYDKYVLSMFPYPSGNLHLGHVKIYTSADIIARYNTYNGLRVHNPMGWDSFGLPAENAAIQNNLNPKTWTYNNIETMRSQLESLGLNVSWKEATSDVSFYKWTQWLMCQLFKHDLLYKSYGIVNWDPVDETVLANDQVDEDGRSWRSGALVEKRFLSQWFIKTSSMINDLYHGHGIKKGAEGIHMEHVLNIQKDFIGEPNGHVFYLNCHLEGKESQSSSSDNVLPVFTPKPELFYEKDVKIAVSNEHWLASVAKDMKFSIENPFTSQAIDFIIADETINVPTGFNATLVSANETDETQAEENRRKIFGYCSKNPKVGGYKTSSTYFDWLVSRQRYWGCPIPIIKCNNCGYQVVSETELPVILPDVDTINTKGKDVDSKNEVRSKLREVAPKEWLMCSCPKCGSNDAQRETDTFDTFVDSSWYFLRYGLSCSSTADVPFSSKQSQVNVYLGGPEHAKGHLIQSRFMFHFLKKYQYLDINYDEPFEKLLLMGIITSKTFKLININQDLLTANNNSNYITEDKVNELVKEGKINKKKNLKVVYEKMSKSKGNGVNPNEFISSFGTDATRLCVLGTGSPWRERNWRGTETEMKEVTKFLRKLILTVDQHIYVNELISEEALINEGEKVMAPIIRRFAVKNAKDVKDKTIFGVLKTGNEDELIKKGINELFQAKNETIVKVLTCYEHSYRLGRASKYLSSLLETIRKFSLIKQIAISDEYAKSLMTVLLLIRPIIPHIASECALAIADTSKHQFPDFNVENVKIPKVDENYDIPIQVTLDGHRFVKIKVKRSIINEGDEEEITKLVINNLINEHKLIRKENIDSVVSIKGVFARVNLISNNVKSLQVISEEKDAELKRLEEEEKLMRKKKKKTEGDEDEDSDDE